MAIFSLGPVWRRGVLLSLWTMLCAVPAAWAQMPSVMLVWSKGTVTVRRSGTAEYAATTQRMPLAPGDILRTDANSEAVLLYPNGARLKLGPNTVLPVSAAWRAMMAPGHDGSGPRFEGMGPGSPRAFEAGGPHRGGRGGFGPHPDGVGPRRDGDGSRRDGIGPSAEGVGPHRDGTPRWGTPDKGRTPPTPAPGAAGGMHPGHPGPWPAPAPGAAPAPPFPDGPPRPPFGKGPPLPPGSVLVRRSGMRIFVPLTPDATLNPGDLVRTGPNTSVTLHFADGSQVKLRENCGLIIPPTAGRTAITAMRADRAP